MPDVINVKCPCGTVLKAPVALAGKKARCAACGQAVMIPEPAVVAAALEGELTLEEPEQSGPDKASAGRNCPHCSKPLGAGALLCLKCGYDMRTGNVVRTVAAAARTEDDDEPRIKLYLPWDKIIIAGVILLLLGGIGLWWMTGPGRDFKHVATTRVEAATLMTSLGRLKPIDIQPGWGPSGKPTISVKGPLPGMSHYDNLNSVGGSDHLIVTTESSTGDHLVVELIISQRFMIDHKMDSMYDVVFSGGAFVLSSASGEKVEGFMLKEDLENNFVLNLKDADSNDYKAMLPVGATPAKEQVERGDRGTVVHSVMNFDGNNPGEIKGDLEAVATPPVAYFKARGLGGTGELTMPGPKARDVVFTYASDALQVTWDQRARGYWGTNGYKEKADFSPFFKYPVRILFKRPTSPGPWTLLANGDAVAEISDD